MFPRKMVVNGSMQTRDIPGAPAMSEVKGQAITGTGNVTLTPNDLAGGLILRSGPSAAGFTDTLPSADSLIAALGDVGPGDSFGFIINNTSNQTCTIAAGAGITLQGTTTVATNKSREYLVELVATKPTVIMPGTVNYTVVADRKKLSGFTAAQCANVMPGMLVTGTGVGASAKVVGVAPDAGIITVDVDNTAEGAYVALTFTPAVNVRGLRLCDV